MDDKCLICEDEKKVYALKCKICGMGIKHVYCTHHDFVFCSIKCRNVFTRMMEAADEKGKEELMKKPVVF